MLMRCDRLIVFICFLALSSTQLGAQYKIGLIIDYEPINKIGLEYENSIRSELNTIIGLRADIQIQTYYGSRITNQYDSIFNQAYLENDLIIAAGTLSSYHIAKRSTYLKPTIASIVLDRELLGFEKTKEGSSGMENLTYIESPFDIQRDIQLLYQIYPFNHLEILLEEGALGEEQFIQELFGKYIGVEGVTVDHLYYGEDLSQHLHSNEGDSIAIYMLPYLGGESAKIQSTIGIINESKIPSVALFGEDYLELGAMAGYESRKNLSIVPRRIALTTLKIIEGHPIDSISVETQTFNENLIINMEACRITGIYPDFDLMSQATILNIENTENNTLNLQQVIALALKENLSIAIEEKDIGIANQNLKIGQSDLYPQVDVSSVVNYTDEFTAFTRQGAQGRFNGLLSGNATQLIYSEPVLANNTINRYLEESEKLQLLETQLDVIVDVSAAYFNVLFAKNNLYIQQQNVERTKENYNISKTKEAIGYVGNSDINRWEAEMSNASIQLNDAVAQMRQAKYSLNGLLNKEIDSKFTVEEVGLAESAILITDDRMSQINNYGLLEKFSDFLVQFALENLPEINQIDVALLIEKRLLKSRERSFYLPSLSASGSYNRTIFRQDIPEGLMPIENMGTWEMNLGMSYPIFQGGRRAHSVQKSRLSLLQLESQKKQIENSLEIFIRSNIEAVAASYSRMELAQQAALASRKNYNIVRDAYSAGQSNIITLLDAQNNALSTELNASNAVFTFILDFIELERSSGFFYFLAEEAERNSFITELQQYLIQE